MQRRRVPHCGGDRATTEGACHYTHTHTHPRGWWSRAKNQSVTLRKPVSHGGESISNGLSRVLELWREQKLSIGQATKDREVAKQSLPGPATKTDPQVRLPTNATLFLSVSLLSQVQAGAPQNEQFTPLLGLWQIGLAYTPIPTLRTSKQATGG